MKWLNQAQLEKPVCEFLVTKTGKTDNGYNTYTIKPG